MQYPANEKPNKLGQKWIYCMAKKKLFSGETIDVQKL